MMEALVETLDRLAAEGQVARFWLRDDDATVPTPALDRLLEIAANLPLTLAVIPQPTGDALARRLRDAAGVTVAPHGWSHANHAGAGEKSQELGPHRSTGVVLAELREGLAKLAALYGPMLAPLCVPPWNRIAPEVAAGLAEQGFRALSVFGSERPGPIPQVNTQVDVIDWRGTRGGRPEAELVAEIVARIEAGGPVGILTHHLVHDEAVWAFLVALYRATALHPAARWVPVTDLM